MISKMVTLLMEPAPSASPGHPAAVHAPKSAGESARPKGIALGFLDKSSEIGNGGATAAAEEEEGDATSSCDGSTAADDSEYAAPNELGRADESSTGPIDGRVEKRRVVGAAKVGEYGSAQPASPLLRSRPSTPRPSMRSSPEGAKVVRDVLGSMGISDGGGPQL